MVYHRYRMCTRNDAMLEMVFVALMPESPNSSPTTMAHTTWKKSFRWVTVWN